MSEKPVRKVAVQNEQTSEKIPDVSFPYCPRCYEEANEGARVCGSPLSWWCDRHLIETLARFELHGEELRVYVEALQAERTRRLVR